MDIHTLTGTEDGENVDVAFHFTVPDANNAVGQNYRALITLFESPSSRVPGLDANHVSQIENGEIYEVVVPFQTRSEDTQQDREARLTQLWQEQSQGLVKAKENQYKWTGKAFNVGA